MNCIIVAAKGMIEKLQEEVEQTPKKQQKMVKMKSWKKWIACQKSMVWIQEEQNNNN